MQLCVTLVTKLVCLPYAKNDLEINICYVFTACYINPYPANVENMVSS